MATEDDVLLQELLATFEQGSTAALPEPTILGGFFGGAADTNMGPGGIPYAPGQAPTVYYEGSDAEVLRAMNTEQLSRFQDALVANGLVREVIPGRLDDNTIKGMSTLMALGNRQGVKWQDVLDGISRAGGLSGEKTVEEFEPQPYLTPDYATLAQKVKSTFEKELGRDPDEAEMAHLVGELQGWDRQLYDAGTAADRLAFDQAQQPGVQGGGTIQSVDPMARFAELFESKYKNELDFVDDKVEAQKSRQTVESTTDTLSAMSKGRM